MPPGGMASSQFLQGTTMEKKTPPARPDWLAQFESILTEPGKLGDHYRAFHKYSLGNQALAVWQLCMRGLQVSPISSFNGWKQKGRMVKKGEKAIALWMPCTPSKKETTSDAGDAAGEKSEVKRSFFMMRNNWFAFSQTEPDPRASVEAEPDPELQINWDKDQALAKLEIREVPFTQVNGNRQGFAMPISRVISINPLAGTPMKTTFHEMAHCILHASVTTVMEDGIELSMSLIEAEAEATAFLCCSALGLPGLESSRAYVQGWLSSTAEREQFKKSAGRVFSAADKILKAGLVVKEVEEAHA